MAGWTVVSQDGQGPNSIPTTPNREALNHTASAPSDHEMEEDDSSPATTPRAEEGD